MSELPRLYDLEVEKVSNQIRSAIVNERLRARIGIPFRPDCTEEQWIDMLRALLAPGNLQTDIVVGESGRPYAVDVHWDAMPNLECLEHPSVPVISTIHHVRTPPERKRVYARIRRLGSGGKG